MRISPLDSPRSQFLGPVTVVTLLHKHLAALGAHFADANAITGNIFEVLFDGSRAALRQDVLDAVRAVDPQDAVFLENAFNVSADLSRADKMRSIDFINGIIQVDRDVIVALADEFRKNPVPAAFDVSVFDYLAQIIASNEIKAIRPTERPTAESLINMGLFSSIEELNEFARDYIHYGYAELYYNYAAYYSYGGQGYSYPYAALELNLKDYINNQLKTTGIMGWLYRPNQRFSDAQLNNIANHVGVEIPATRTAALAVIGWQGFNTGTHRNLDVQVQASMSECAKRDASIRAMLTKS